MFLTFSFSFGVITHFAPQNISSFEWSKPVCSVPDIGCEPIKLKLYVLFINMLLTEATSVTIVFGLTRLFNFCNISSTFEIGEHTKITSQIFKLFKSFETFGVNFFALFIVSSFVVYAKSSMFLMFDKLFNIEPPIKPKLIIPIFFIYIYIPKTFLTLSVVAFAISS